MDAKEIVERFQCPGCTIGSDTKCGRFVQDVPNLACSSHSAGTYISGGVGNINLGLPRGFNRLGPVDKMIQKNNIRIFDKMYDYNIWNIPVWVSEVEEGVLLLRTYLPRRNETWVDIIPGAKIADLPEPFRSSVIDVTKQDMD